MYMETILHADWLKARQLIPGLNWEQEDEMKLLYTGNQIT